MKKSLLALLSLISLAQQTSAAPVITETHDRLTADIMSQNEARLRLDGRYPVQIFARERLVAGDRIHLDRSYGVSLSRIERDGSILESSPCPEGWQIHFLDSRGNIISQSRSTPSRLVDYSSRSGGEVPRGAVSAWIGFSDTAYFDNEGFRAASRGSTGGCRFDFALVSGSLTETHRNLLASTMTRSNEIRRLDGTASVEVFGGLLQPGVIRLRHASGVSVGRVHKGRAQASEPCPDGWKIEFEDRYGRILSPGRGSSDWLRDASRSGVSVPYGAERAYIGYDDSAYFDNEGRRPVSFGSTRGCTFELELLPH